MEAGIAGFSGKGTLPVRAIALKAETEKRGLVQREDAGFTLIQFEAQGGESPNGLGEQYPCGVGVLAEDEHVVRIAEQAAGGGGE